MPSYFLRQGGGRFLRQLSGAFLRQFQPPDVDIGDVTDTISSLVPARVWSKLFAERVWERAGDTGHRVWRYDMPTMPRDRLYKTPTEGKTFGFDYSKEGSVRGGETLSNPVVTVSGSGAPTVAGSEITDEDFFDSDGQFFESGKGVKSRLTGGTAGTYNVKCSVTTSGGDTLEVLGKIVVAD